MTLRLTIGTSCSILSAALALTVSSCRTGARSSVSPDDPIAVNVTLYQVTDSDISQYKLNVQMALCSDATGTKVDGTTYKFQIASIPKDTTCQIHLVGAKSSAAGVQFYTNNDGLYYKDDQVVIKADATGALKGDAYLQALFSPNTNNKPGTTTWQIVAPVTSKAALVDTCTCNLDCSPKLTNHTALFVKGNTPNDGSCTFVNASASGLTSVQCTKMNVQCGEAFYAASYSPAASADATANKSTSLPSVDLQPGVPSAEGDVSIDVQIKNKPAGN